MLRNVPDHLIRLDPDETTEPFWSAASRHELIVPECGACKQTHMPPLPICPACGSSDVAWRQARPVGTIYSFTITEHALTSLLADSVPYGIAVVELDDAHPARLVLGVVDSERDSVRIGARVEIVWRSAADGATVPRCTITQPIDPTLTRNSAKGTS